MTGDLDRAEECFEQSLRLDTTNFALYYNMASLQRDLGNTEKYVQYLERSAACDGVAPRIEKELVVAYLRRNEISKAVAAFRRSDQLAADTTFVRQIRQRYPQWDSLMRAP